MDNICCLNMIVNYLMTINRFIKYKYKGLQILNMLYHFVIYMCLNMEKQNNFYVMKIYEDLIVENVNLQDISYVVVGWNRQEFLLHVVQHATG